MRKKEGRIITNNYGTKLSIIKDLEDGTVIVQDIDNNCLVGIVSYGDLIRKKVVSPLDKQFYGVGYLGLGQCNEEDNKVEFKYYKKFLEAGYYKNHKYRHMIDFQKFCAWHEDNFYIVNRIDSKGYKCVMKICMLNDNLVYLPYDIVNVISANASDYWNYYDYEYRVKIPTISGNVKRVGIVSKLEQAEQLFKIEIEEYVRTLGEELLIDIPYSIIELLEKFEYELK